MLTTLDFTARLLLALSLGAGIGIERQWRQRIAGLRTNTLVSLGAAIFIKSWATAPVVALTSLVMLIGIAIPFSPFAAVINLEPLPLGYFPWLIGILTCYCLLTQYIKNRFIQKFHQWL